jgi:hypothetical protein
MASTSGVPQATSECSCRDSMATFFRRFDFEDQRRRTATGDPRIVSFVT